MRARNSKASKEKFPGPGSSGWNGSLWERGRGQQDPSVDTHHWPSQGSLPPRTAQPKGPALLGCCSSLQAPACTSHKKAEHCGHSYFPFIKETAFPSWRRFVLRSVAEMLYTSPSSCFLLLPACSFLGKGNFPYGLSLDGNISPQWIWWAQKTPAWNLNGNNLKHLGEEKVGIHWESLHPCIHALVHIHMRYGLNLCQ